MEVRRQWGAAAVVAAVLVQGCSGLPTSPSKVDVIVAFTSSGGTYSATLNGQTYSAEGGFPVSLSPGTHTISGSFRASIFGIGFGSAVGGGGVLSGSPRSVTGSGAEVGSCQVSYSNFSTPGTTRTFSVTFQTTSSAGSACQ